MENYGMALTDPPEPKHPMRHHDLFGSHAVGQIPPRRRTYPLKHQAIQIRKNGALALGSSKGGRPPRRLQFERGIFTQEFSNFIYRDVSPGLVPSQFPSEILVQQGC